MLEEISPQDKIMLEIVSSSMCSLNFLRNATDAIFDNSLKHDEIGKIYDGWINRFGEKCGANYVPYSTGAVVGYLYCGILLTKEQWFDFLPDEPIENVGAEWALEKMNYSCPFCKKPTIKYVFRRLRNAMAHGNIKIVPKLVKDVDKMDAHGFEKNVYLTFHDKRPSRQEDFFEATIPLYDLSHAITKFHTVVCEHLYE
ncbi:MAG: hypothetical protein KUA39_13620 [Desulfarculus sp.]|nr:hypothetical protein [Desulfarculus sp.]